jgi:hypothetical protein
MFVFVFGAHLLSAAFFTDFCRRLGIKDNEKRWMDALSNNLDAKRDRAVLCVVDSTIMFALDYCR